MKMHLKASIYLVVLGATAFAAEPRIYQSGKVTQLDFVQCGIRQNDLDAAASEAASSDVHKPKTPACREYVIEADDVSYRIRPRDAKHAPHLPVGDMAQFRLEKERMLVRIDDLSNKEREYIVVSIRPRTESNAADARPAHINHLQ
jgi:hypothetical protein